MKKMIAVVCIAALMLGLVAAAQVESFSSGMSVYSAGKYQVGSDIEAGEYILFAIEDQEASFKISSDAEGTVEVSKGVFSTNTLLTVATGDYLDLSGCFAVWGRDYYSMYTVKLDEIGGMLKVGADIEPGVYMLSAQDGHPASYRVYQDVRLRLVADEKEFEDNCQVRLRDNQYLELVNCRLLGLMPEDESIVIVHPTPPPIPTPSVSSSPVSKPTSSGRRGSVLATATPKPTAEPTPEPTAAPTPAPTPEPTAFVTPEPSELPVPDQLPIDELTPVPSNNEDEESEPEAEPDELPAEEEKTEMPDADGEQASEALEENAPEKTAQKVRIDKIRTPTIRTEPTTKGKKLGVAKGGMEYELLETEGNWYKILLEDGKEGWIISTMAELVE